MPDAVSEQALATTLAPPSPDGRSLREEAELTYSHDGAIIMPERLGRYRVRSLLGQGAFGQVYEAHDEQLDRKVALKILHSRVSDELSTARLQREAQALAALEHPNVVSIYDVGTATDEDGRARVFVAMELVDGESFDAWLRQGPHDPETVIAVMRQVAEGLIAVHGAGMVHRDLKPGNILLALPRALEASVGKALPQRVCLADFGLARPDPRRHSTEDGLSTRAEHAGDKTLGGTRSRTGQVDLLDVAHPALTATGAVLGTPAYMAPEQFVGEACTQASDQFSFAVILYEALTGERPFTGKDIHGLRAAVLRGIRQPLPKGKRLPRRLGDLIDRALQVDPALRFDSMHEVADLLQRPARRSRRIYALGLGALMATAASMAWAGSGKPPGCTAPNKALGASWDRTRRRAVGGALEDASAAIGEQTASRVVERLDRYATDWVDAYRTACELPLHDTRRDASLSCLQAAHRELDVAASVLETADEAVVRNAVVIASQPRAPHECLQAQRGPDEAHSAEQAELIDNLRGQLARSRALHSAGRYDLAATLARDALGQAEEAGLAKMAARAGYRLGMVQAGSGSLEEGERTLTRAYFAAQASGDDEIAARAAVALVGLVGGFFGRAEDGEAWDRHAVNHLDRIEDDAGIRVALEMRRGQMAWGRGDFEAAQAHFERGLELGSQADPDDPNRGPDQTNLGIILLERGRFEQARDVFAEAAESIERMYGPSHTKLAVTLSDLGHAHYELRDLEAAQSVYERARRIYATVYGPEHVQTLECDEHLANVFMARGEFERAIAIYRGTLAAYEKAGKADSWSAALTHENLGLALAKAGQTDEGVAQLQIAVDLARKHRPSGHPEIARSLDTLSSVYLQAQRFDEALATGEEALQIHEATLPADHPDIAGTHKDIGEALFALGQTEEGMERVGQAVELLAGRPERQIHLASARFTLGRMLWESGTDRRRGATLVREATATLAEHGRPGAVLREEISKWRERHGV